MSDETPLISKADATRSVGLVYAFDFLTKYGAAFGLTALGTAFLFDSIYWWIVDSRILTYYVVSDHIQTAVRIAVLLCPIVAVLGFLFLWYFVSSDDFPAAYAGGKTGRARSVMTLKRIVLPLLMFALFATEATYTSGKIHSIDPEMKEVSARTNSLKQQLDTFEQREKAEGENFLSSSEAQEMWRHVTSSLPETERLFNLSKRRFKILTSIFEVIGFAILVVIPFVAVLAGIPLINAFVLNLLKAHPVRCIIICWVSITAYGAVVEGVFIRDGLVLRVSGVGESTHDTIFLEGDRSLKGTVIRNLDRGTIFRDGSNGEMIFVPKERIFRVELGVE